MISLGRSVVKTLKKTRLKIKIIVGLVFSLLNKNWNSVDENWDG